MITNPDRLELIALAHQLGAEVVGFASNRLYEMSQDNAILKNMNTSLNFIFTSVFLDHVTEAYNMQIKALGAKMTEINGNKT